MCDDVSWINVADYRVVGGDEPSNKQSGYLSTRTQLWAVDKVQSSHNVPRFDSLFLKIQDMIQRPLECNNPDCVVSKSGLFPVHAVKAVGWA